MAIYRCKCNKCDFSSVTRDNLMRYRSESGDEFLVKKELIVCSSCNECTFGEKLLAELEIKGILDSRSDLTKREIAYYRKYLTNMSRRVSPPRCLQCGATEIQSLGLDLKLQNKTAIHSGCGGTIEVRAIGLNNSKLISYYSCEGEEILYSKEL